MKSVRDTAFGRITCKGCEVELRRASAEAAGFARRSREEAERAAVEVDAEFEKRGIAI